jgi:tRNA pseudouridine38-40 synthase
MLFQHPAKTETMPRFALSLEYDGAAYAGTQAQKEQRTLQQTLADAAAALAGTPTPVRLSSRLDSGVGALALTADCHFDRDWDPSALGRALIGHLPDDVVVRRVAMVANGWDAQRDAIAKTYRYRVLRRAVRPVIDIRNLWVRRLDRPDLLQPLAVLVVGRRDLSGFACLRGDGSDTDDPVRDYTTAAWTHEQLDDADLWIFRITGSGFLYKQIRGLVGAMVRIAQGHIPPERFGEVIAQGRQAPRLANLAPARGLILERVAYAPEPDWQAV